MGLKEILGAKMYDQLNDAQREQLSHVALPTGLAKNGPKADLIKVLYALDILKYRGRGDAITLAIDGSVTRQITKTDTEINEKNHVMQRAVSYALASIAIVEHSQLSDKQKQQAINAVVLLTQQFLENVSKYPEHHLDNLIWKNLINQFNKHLLLQTTLLKQGGIDVSVKDILRMEQYVVYDIGRPVYTTESQIQQGREYKKVIQTTTPIEEFTAEQVAQTEQAVTEQSNLGKIKTGAAIERRFLQGKAKNKPEGFKSATDRTRTGLSNFVRHDFFLSDQQDNPQQSLVTYSFSMPAPRVKSQDTPQAKRITEQNVRQFLQKCAGITEQYQAGLETRRSFLSAWGLTDSDLPADRQIVLPIALRSYLSPLPTGVNLVDADHSSFLLQQEAAIVAAENNKMQTKDKMQPRVYFCNYPINGQRVLMPGAQRVETDDTALQLVKDTLHNLALIAQAKQSPRAKEIETLADAFARINSFDQINADLMERINNLSLTEAKQLFVPDSSEEKRLKLLKAALVDYIALHRDTAAGNGRNKGVFLASLQSIIVNNMGGVDAGHCISGKDRTAFVNMHAKAMLVYFEQYGNLPNYRANDEKRSQFVVVFKDMYRTLHDAEQAGFNNRGSAGVKDEPGVKSTMPKDMRKALADTMVISKRAAGLNKPKPKAKTWRDLIPLFVITALAIGICAASPFIFPVIGAVVGLAVVGVGLGCLAGALTYFLNQDMSLKKRLGLSLLVGGVVAGVFALPFLGVAAPFVAGISLSTGVGVSELLAITVVPALALVSLIKGGFDLLRGQRDMTQKAQTLLQTAPAAEVSVPSSDSKAAKLMHVDVKQMVDKQPTAASAPVAGSTTNIKQPPTEERMPQGTAALAAKVDHDIHHHPKQAVDGDSEAETAPLIRPSGRKE